MAFKEAMVESEAAVEAVLSAARNVATATAAMNRAVQVARRAMESLSAIAEAAESATAKTVWAAREERKAVVISDVEKWVVRAKEHGARMDAIDRKRQIEGRSK
jgi:type II secretory pathway component GspD/PulD (secretin)